MSQHEERKLIGRKESPVVETESSDDESQSSSDEDMIRVPKLKANKASERALNAHVMVSDS